MIRISSKDPSEPSDDKPISGDERGSLSAPAQSRETESNAAGREQLDKQGATRVINDSASIEEIVVTGTHIRGVTDLTVPVSSFSRADIDRRGYLTTQDFVLSLPQNFRGGNNGVSEDGVINSGAGLSNVESASGINLRGLGTGSTLVLINGHRVAPANVGSSVDVSMIPLSAIERIDISVDGASAIYGADAVGGVVNFILRKDYSGAETHLFGGLPTRGGGREHFGAGQTFGRTGDRGGAVLSLQYQSFSDLSTEERDFTADVPDPTDLYPSSRKYSALFNGHHELAENVELFADVLYNHATSERAITAFALTQGFDAETDSSSVNGGVAWGLPGAWRVEVSGLYSRVNTLVRQHFAPALEGYSNGDPLLRSDFKLTEANAKADGALMEAPGGTARAAVGVSWRNENYVRQVYHSTLLTSAGREEFNRDVTADFLELYYPLIGQSNAVPFAQRLELSASVRHERYTDFGDSTNPRFGIFWQPHPDWSLRASYGRSFHAPTARDELNNAVNLQIYNFPFESPGGGEEIVLLLAGSPELVPETSRNLSFGVDYRPVAHPALSVSLNYFDIDYRDRLITAPFDASALLRRDVYGTLIRDFPDDAAVAAYVAELEARGFVFFDLTETGLTGIRHAISSGGLINAARVRQEGIDASIRYDFSLSNGTLHLGLNGTYLKRIDTGFCTSCTATDLVDTYGQPLSLRARTEAGWSRGSWQVNAALNYADSYTDTTVAPPRDIASWTTFDLNIRYLPETLSGWMIGLNILNAFDKDPPRTGAGVVFQNFHYDSANADPLGRVISAQFRLTW